MHVQPWSHPTSEHPLKLAFRAAELRLGRMIPFHPHALSLLKLWCAGPLLFLLAHPASGGLLRHLSLVALFMAFASLDYLDGLVARSQGKESWLGRILDRATDLPILVVFARLGHATLPMLPLALKLGLDALLLLLFAAGRGSTHNRLRTTVSYLTVLCLTLLSEGAAKALVTRELVADLLWLNALISFVIVLRRIGLLHRRRVADLLSLSNLGCGVLSMTYAAQGKLMACLFLLTLGAALDGLDGAAARRWGGSRFGVYMDDLADGVSYGLAPGYALWVSLGETTGLIVGGLLAAFVITRLVFFTLDKGSSDPNLFRGVPSTVGAIVSLAALIVFPEEEALIGLFVGMACVLMVSFDVYHRHLGRALASRNARALALAYVLVLLTFTLLTGPRLAVALVLGSALTYAFVPSALAFARCVATRRAQATPPTQRACAPHGAQALQKVRSLDGLEA